jgi:hypothetical protein
MEVFKYPCINRYNFLDFSIATSPQYEKVLYKMKTYPNAKLLDLGCCFGQDLRQLRFEGVAPERLMGSELMSEFVEFGYELFRDKETLGAEFRCGDFFDDSWAGLKDARGAFQFIYAASFFHLFPWDQQVEAMSRTVQLLQPVKGSAIFGRQLYVEQAGEVKTSLMGGTMFRHNEDSFKKLVAVVAEKTGMELKCETKREQDQTSEEDWKTRLQFWVELVG